jgi:uncharacterized protein
MMDEQSVLLIGAATAYVQECMSTFDASHDYNHITRVLDLAKLILKDENSSLPLRSTAPRGDRTDWKPVPSVGLSEPLIVLGALLHDVNDRKYLNQAQEPVSLIDLLTGWGAQQELATQVERLCRGVSYSTEIRNPQCVKDLIQEIPELAVVQDADRLDAIGAIGIGRCFTFGASRGRGLPDSIMHFEEKLLRLETTMKTRLGREMARIRTERVREFMRWWDDETQVAATGIGL